MSQPPLPFLKKWVRTRHAVLFRLSNRTVQVVFSDLTEMMLSEEACRVTYVDKSGTRETYPLQRVLEEDRTDIAKRLRYTKDMMTQLLAQSKRS
ncbi:unnamed protein product [Discosporangium mesarthrocarpum]